MQKHELIAEVDVLLGGRAAEDVFLGEISTGASNDLERATDIAKSMVMIYGMSDIAGLMVMEKRTNQFLGGGYSQNKDYSDKLAQDLDNFVIEFLNARFDRVRKDLKKYSEAMEEMVAELFKDEVISGDKVTQILLEFEKRKKIKSDWFEQMQEEKAMKEALEGEDASAFTAEQKAVAKDASTKKDEDAPKPRRGRKPKSSE